MRCTCLFAILIGLAAHAQTGPGGVGPAGGNVLWLRADRGVTTIGPEVTNWADQSGSANNAAAPSVAARPAQLLGSLNGYPIIRFDGANDELRIPDAGSLDMTQWHMFMVSAEVVPGNNNAWFCKGTSTQPNYALWSPMNGAVQMPVYDVFGGFGGPSAPAGTTTTSFNVIEYSGRVVLFVLPIRTLYKNATNVYTDVSPFQWPATNGNPLYIGATQNPTGWNLDGSLAELIFYNAGLNSAQRIIVNNYLAAKYGLTLASSDHYSQDLPANGNYDHDVAGIGRVGTNTHNNSRGTGIVQINAPSGLDANEFMLWGHDNGLLGTFGVTDFPPTVQGRLGRVWRVSEVSTSNAAIDVGSVNVIFDLNGLGPVTATDLRLLVDQDNDGVFADETPIGGATALGGGQYRFAGVTQLANNLRFTLATLNLANTPLPVELISFTAEVVGARSVLLEWSTASENNSDHFTVERSDDGAHWLDVGTVAAMGNSSELVQYALSDDDALTGVSFYRLRQVDLDGGAVWSNTVAVRIEAEPGQPPVLYPNPTEGGVNLAFASDPGPILEIALFDLSGRPVRNWRLSSAPVVGIDLSGTGSGLHYLRVQANDNVWTLPVQVIE